MESCLSNVYQAAPVVGQSRAHLVVVSLQVISGTSKDPEFQWALLTSLPPLFFLEGPEEMHLLLQMFVENYCGGRPT